VVKRSYLEFVLTGLEVSSAIELDKMATVLKGLVVGEIGELGGHAQERSELEAS